MNTFSWGLLSLDTSNLSKLLARDLSDRRALKNVALGAKSAPNLLSTLI